MARILILTASVGEGHDLPARMLADALCERGAEVAVVDGLEAIGGPMARVAEGGARLMSYRGRAALDAQYAVFGRSGPGRAFARRTMARLGRRGLTAVIERERPDAIVTTYPGFNETLGWMRLRGQLAVPVASAITDLASLWFWAAPGIDLHLLTHPQSMAEVRRIAPESRIVPVHGLTRPEFLDPPPRATARAALGLDADRPVIVVSGGGWGVGDIHGAVDIALSNQVPGEPGSKGGGGQVPGEPGSKGGGGQVVVLCGRNDALRAQVDAEFGERVQTFGFTDRMAEILSAGDCLVHSSAGLTVLEALMWLPADLLRLGRGAHPPQQQGVRRARPGRRGQDPRRTACRDRPGARHTRRAGPLVRRAAGRRGRGARTRATNRATLTQRRPLYR